MSVASGKPIPAGETERREHEDLSLPYTKRVLLYGWDGRSKVRLAVDEQGAIGTSLITRVATVGDKTYVGDAVPGTATSAAAWRVYEIDSSSDVSCLVADSGRFSQVWDNRASLSYS